jgi:hypothetical protein
MTGYQLSKLPLVLNAAVRNTDGDIVGKHCKDRHVPQRCQRTRLGLEGLNLIERRENTVRSVIPTALYQRDRSIMVNRMERRHGNGL